MAVVISGGGGKDHQVIIWAIGQNNKKYVELITKIDIKLQHIHNIYNNRTDKIVATSEEEKTVIQINKQQQSQHYTDYFQKKTNSYHNYIVTSKYLTENQIKLNLESYEKSVEIQSICLAKTSN